MKEISKRIREVQFNGDDAPRDDPELTLDEFDRWKEEVARNIGHIVIEFNILDDSVSFSLAEMTFERLGCSDERSAVFVGEMLFRQKAVALVKLFGMAIRIGEFEEFKERLDELATRLSEAAERRNRYAHGSWQQSDSCVWVQVGTKVTGKGERAFHKYYSFRPEEMAEDLEFIRQTNDLLGSLHDDLSDRQIQ